MNIILEGILARERFDLYHPENTLLILKLGS
jgi:hypothetical protein